MKNPDEHVEMCENRIYGAKTSTYLTIAAIATLFAILTIWLSGF